MDDDYNFEPDYETWWNKESLTKEQLVLLMLGVNPDDEEKSKILSAKPNRTHDEQEWTWGYSNYTRNLNPFLGDAFRHGMQLLKSDCKNYIYQEAYDNRFDINNTLQDFLILAKVLAPNPKLEKHKEHSIFEEKNSDIGAINSQNESHDFAKIIGVEPLYFDRFITLDDRCEKEPKDNGYVAYVTFEPEEKWFYSEYGKFIGSFYKCRHTDLTRFFRKIRSHELWDLDFYKYCQNIHDAGFIFKSKTYRSLNDKGIKLKYTKDGWAYNFYSEWILKKPLWNLEIAGKLFTGADPNGGRELYGMGDFEKGRAGHGLNDYKTVLFFDKNGEWKEPVIKNFLEETSLENFVRRHIAKGTIEHTYEHNGILEFEPKEIVRFLKDYCPNTCQPHALYNVLGLTTDKSLVNKSEAKRINNLLTSEREARTRKTPWHEDVGRAIKSAETKLEHSPSAFEVKKEIKDNLREYEHIIRFDHDSKNDEVIHVVQANGQKTTIGYGRFEDVVSKKKKANS